MKKWPADGRMIDAEGAIKPLMKVIQTLYKLERTDAKSADYTGYEFTQPLTATTSQPDDTFSKDGLEYHGERGREPVEMALWVAFQLGFLQGLRSDRRSDQRQMLITLLETALDTLKR